jgi:DNA-binding winged helix-turn-helix (wHTH) protein
MPRVSPKGELKIPYIFVQLVDVVENDGAKLSVPSQISNGETMNPHVTRAKARFADFELDLRSGELARNGRRVPLQCQPFRVLTLLLEHSQELVPRDDLQRLLWRGDTFVDFDHGLNKAIAKLRDAFDLPGPRSGLIETFPRRGYRFTSPVEWFGEKSAPSHSSSEIVAAVASLVLVSNKVTSARHPGHAPQGTLVLLAPDLLDTFPDSDSVNEALRALKKIARTTNPGPQYQRIASAGQ